MQQWRCLHVTLYLPVYSYCFIFVLLPSFLFFFFNDTATTEIYTLSLHDALPICRLLPRPRRALRRAMHSPGSTCQRRSEEHTSELQSPCNLVCRLLLEKKKKKKNSNDTISHQILE